MNWNIIYNSVTNVVGNKLMFTRQSPLKYTFNFYSKSTHQYWWVFLFYQNGEVPATIAGSDNSAIIK